MVQHRKEFEVRGPWSLTTSRAFWEGFAPAALPKVTGSPEAELRTVFRVEADWSRAEARVLQRDGAAIVTVCGPGDLEAAAGQVARFLSLDIDATDWPEVGRRDPVIAAAQARLLGLRPCGFHSPYEAAAWAVLSQRLRVPQAAQLRADLTRRFGDDGAFPAPAHLRTLDLDLPGRKAEYLHAVAEAALDGLLDGTTMHSADPEQSIRSVRTVKGLGPFAADLVVLRGAGVPDGLPHHEPLFAAEVQELYGPGTVLSEVSQAWRPFRTWAAVHLRAQQGHRRYGPGRPTPR